jgi:hypothetical protein
LPGPKTAPAAKGEAEFIREFTQDDLNSNPKGGNDDDDDEERHHHGGRHQQRAECGVQ